VIVADATPHRAETPAGTSLVLAESLGHSHELLGKLYQRRPGVEIRARGRELAAVACALLEHLRVHGLDPAPYLNAAGGVTFRENSRNST
jgi:hypothetical protein